MIRWNGIGIEDIVLKGTEPAPDLQETRGEDQSSALHQAFLYGSHAVDESSGAIYDTVAPVTKLAHIVAMKSSGNLQINSNRIWRQASRGQKTVQASASPEEESEDAEGVKDGNQAETLPSDCEFTATVVRSHDEGWSELQLMQDGSRLSATSRSTGLTTIFLAQWPGPGYRHSFKECLDQRRTTALHRKLSALKECVPATRTYPVVRMSATQDGNYLPVGSESRAISAALSRFKDVSK